MAIGTNGGEIDSRIDPMGTSHLCERRNMVDVNEIGSHRPVDTSKVKSADSAGRAVNLDT